MTISNTVSGFRMTGIYPTDWHALLKLIPDSSPDPTQQESRLPFVPLINSSPRCHTALQNTESTRCNAQEIQDQAEESFEEKDELFQKWYEANSDITTNKRFNAWLKVHHP